MLRGQTNFNVEDELVMARYMDMAYIRFNFQRSALDNDSQYS